MPAMRVANDEVGGMERRKPEADSLGNVDSLTPTATNREAGVGGWVF